MDNSNIINNLKERSGKSMKFKVFAIRQLVWQAQIFFIIFFSNTNAKLALLMRIDEKERRQINVGHCYFLKNLQFVSEFETLPLFKLSTSSVTKFSQKAIEHVKVFDEGEMAGLEGNINMENAIDMPDVPPPVPGAGIAGPLPNVMSLYEFCLAEPSSIQENHLVEMLVLGCHLAGSKEAFKGASNYKKLACLSVCVSVNKSRILSVKCPL